MASIYRVSYGALYQTAGVNLYSDRRKAIARGYQTSGDYPYVVITETTSDGRSRGVAEWRDRKRVGIADNWVTL